MLRLLESLLRMGRKFPAPEMRRVYEEGRFSGFFETSPIIRWSLGVLTLGLIMLTTGYLEEQPVGAHQFFHAFVIFISSLCYLSIMNKPLLRSNSRLILVIVAIGLNLAVAKALLSDHEIVAMLGSGQFSTAIHRGLFLVPMTFAPLLITTLLGTSAGIFCVVFMSVILAFMADNNFNFLVMSLLTGIMAVYFTQEVRKRSDLIKAGFWVGMAGMVFGLSLGLVFGFDPQSLGTPDFWMTEKAKKLLVLGVWAVAIGTLTGMIVSGILPIFETIFKITTNISWLELSDFNHPLLKQMAIRAPGTYHHSLNVANLAENAAEAVGANALQCRVCSYFHDIGKMVKPEYFIENTNPQMNPHKKLTPQMSALIISAHVKEGVDMALKYKLKKEIIDVIREHHGTSLIYYFYRLAKQQAEDEALGCKILDMNVDDLDEVDENTYRYPGPKPQTRESAIISICDTVEAASRTLVKPTLQRIDDLVRDIIEAKVRDRQLDECDLSLKDLEVIADRITFALKSMLHSRIDYPRPQDDNNDSQDKAPLSSHQAA